MAEIPKPDNTAVRTALWRALHVLADPPPHVFEDDVGLALVAPDDDWQSRGDMGPFTRPFRASIVARGRFVEDRLEDEITRGVAQCFARDEVDLLERPQVVRASVGEPPEKRIRIIAG